MSDIAIKVEGLSKRYRIGALQQQQYRTLRVALNDKALAPFRAARHLLKRNGNGHGPSDYKKSLIDASASQLEPSSVNGDTIWALKDVSFEVKQGEVLGIIGRNGAGKSTLLKILSRITEPTDGYADITGRLASLLEVGTGFHPELTGRENIFLNGSILGMRRAEIRSKFDEIVAFAEVEKFIDTPVKYYSSGMYVRLAFAVAAHLEPENLIVDEVLAVGDAMFQKKCLGKMGDVAREGRTVLLVSHNMGAIRSLSDTVLWIDQGQIHSIGNPPQVTESYLAFGKRSESSVDLDALSRSEPFGQRLRLQRIEFNLGEVIKHGEPLIARVKYRSSSDLEGVSIGFGFSALDGSRIMTVDSDQSHTRVTIKGDSMGIAEARLEELMLQPGLYNLDLGARSSDNFGLDYLPACAQIEVLPGPNTPASIIRDIGGVRVSGTWSWIPG